MMVTEDLASGEWQLRIKDINYSDAGSYECQVNTNPILSHTVFLTVVGQYKQILTSDKFTVYSPEPYTKILLDGPEESATLYIDNRSVLNLTCAVYSPEVPAAIFWKHNGKVRRNN